MIQQGLSITLNLSQVTGERVAGGRGRKTREKITGKDRQIAGEQNTKRAQAMRKTYSSQIFWKRGKQISGVKSRQDTASDLHRVNFIELAEGNSAGTNLKPPERKGPPEIKSSGNKIGSGDGSVRTSDATAPKRRSQASLRENKKK